MYAYYLNARIFFGLDIAIWDNDVDGAQNGLREINLWTTVKEGKTMECHWWLRNCDVRFDDILCC